MTTVLVEHHPYAGTLTVGSHHVARELRERGEEVIWVSHPRSALHRLLGPLAPVRTEHPDGTVEIVLRVALPYIDLPLLGHVLGHRAWGERWIGRRAAAPLVEEIERRGGCDLLWLSDFTQMPLVELVDARRAVLRFFDHLDEFRSMPRSIYSLVRRYLDRVTLALASSKDLTERLADEGIDAHYLPNGAHLRPRPAGLEEAPHEADRVVYVGAIEAWFDTRAVESWARALPEVRFEIAGPDGIGWRPAPPNVHLLGPVPYDELAELLVGAGCGLIPFRVDALTRGVHPLKLYDYLVFGCPVLSSALPEVEPDPRGVYVYRSPQEGGELLEGILARHHDCDALRALAADNTWGRRLDRVFSWLEAA